MSESPAKGQCLYYAGLGYRVLPLRSIIVDSDTGERSCSCGNMNCRSPGKHPLTQYVPRGVLDASSDPEEIAQWPDVVNVGLATGNGLIALDIDDRDMAAAVLEQIHDEVVVRTGKGAHVYKLTSRDFATAILKRSGGGGETARIGELRGNGAYVAAPPSLHVEGQYAFTTEVGIEGLTSTKDPYQWAMDLLKRVGVDLESQAAQADLPDPPDAIPVINDIPFPYPEDSVYLQQLLSGTYHGVDRSSSLYRLACELYRAANKTKSDVDPVSIAGIIKGRDDQFYRKYRDRNDQDLRYWEIAVRARTDVEHYGGTSPASSRFVWDGDFFSIQTDKGVSPICNFEPVIDEELSMLTEEGEPPALIWRLRCRKSDKNFVTIDLLPRQREDARALRRALSNLPYDYIVKARRWEDLMEGIQQYSLGRSKRRAAYGLTGWLPDKPGTFLLPQVAISSRGVESNINYDNPHADNVIRRYGDQMKTPGETGREGLTTMIRDLITVSLPEIVVPLLAQIFGAALQSKLVNAGLDHTRCIVHTFGRTGSYKTSLVSALASVWGDLSRNGVRSWSSTDNALQYALWMSRDLPVIIDDYKASLVRNRASFVQLVQNYADGTTRERLTVAGSGGLTVQRSATPRGLLITTGEDVWEDQESLLARTTMIHVDRSSTDLHILSRLQTAAHSGALAQVGADWLQWLSANMDRVLKAHRVGYSKYRDNTEALHGRSRDNIAQLQTYDRIFAQYLRERYATIDYDPISEEAWRVVKENHAREQIQLAELSPLNQLLDAVREAVNSHANLYGRGTNDSCVGDVRGETVGYVDDGYVYLSRAGTFAWYRARMSRQGTQVPFTWHAVAKEAKDRFGTQPRPIRAGNGLLRLLPIPRLEALGVTEEEEGNVT